MSAYDAFVEIGSEDIRAAADALRPVYDASGYTDGFVSFEAQAASSEAMIDEVKAAARGTQNVLYPMKEALRAKATLGEVSDALREVFGVYTPH